MSGRIVAVAMLLAIHGTSHAQVKNAVSKAPEHAEVIAGQVATDYLLESVRRRLKLQTVYASPAPTEQPLEFVIARTFYSPDSELFESRMSVAKLEIAVLAEAVKSREFTDAILTNAVEASKERDSKNLAEQIELARNEQVTTAVATEIIRVIAGLAEVRLLRDKLKEGLLEAMKRMPANYAALSNVKPISSQLRQSRTSVLETLRSVKATK